MDLGIKGKIALITGGSSGLGLACALVLAREGAKVAISARSQDRLAAAAAGIKEETGTEAVVIPADLTQAGQAAWVVEEAARLLGPVEILVTNCGGPPAGPFEEFGEEDWIRAFKLSELSSLSLIKAALPGMKAAGWGRIVNLTSLSVKQPVPNLILSNGIRAGLIGASKTISQEYGPFGITVNSIATGYTRTERMEELARAKTAGTDKSPNEFLTELASSLPLRRINEPEEVAAAVAFLASEPARAITGVTLAVDRGACLGLL